MVGRLRQGAPHRLMPMLEALAALRTEAFFVQIGSHGFQQEDPLEAIIRRGGWTGIIVEPLPHAFERLRRSYSGLDGIVFENVAIGPEDGDLPFFHLGNAGLDGQPDLGSLRREVIVGYEARIPEMAELLVETAVPSLTFESLCQRHGVKEIDVLHTGATGSDFEILKMLDFERRRPTLIIYESRHLDPVEQVRCLNHLARFEYRAIPYRHETWCLHLGSLSTDERVVIEPLWRWLSLADERQRPLLPTRVARAAARHAFRRGTEENDQLTQWFGLTEAERRYVINRYDDSVSLPPGAEQTLARSNPRLQALRRLYAGLDLPVIQHHMWSEERVISGVDLRWFRGDNLYVWHYLEHPRAMALKLFLYMRYLCERGGRALLDKVSEDGLFGCWTVDIADYGRISRDLLDSVSEVLFLERQLGILERTNLRVLDIGAGYGRLAYRLSQLHPSLADYCCVDAVPDSTFLSEYYLRFRGCSPPSRVLQLDQVESLLPGSFDVAFNVHSFSECPAGAIEWWLGQLRRLRVPYLFVVPNEPDGILSREQDGGTRDAMPLFAAAGYEPVHHEPVIDDPAVQSLTWIYDNYYLFALHGDPGV